MNEEGAPDARRPIYLAVAILTLVVVLSAADLIADSQEHVELEHLALEGVVLALGVAGLVAGLGYLNRLRLSEARLRARLGAARDEAARWRSEAQAALRGLGAAIDAQFGRWELTPAEAEVGLLLLKGLSFKEMAEVRGVSERTVRQQAQAVYKKASVAGRAELSAFFLEDLLLPGHTQDSAPQPSEDARTR